MEGFYSTSVTTEARQRSPGASIAECRVYFLRRIVGGSSNAEGASLPNTGKTLCSAAVEADKAVRQI